MITLDNWSDIFDAARGTAPISATLYFVSFILLGTMIMLILFIGIIMNSMSEMHAEIEERDRARHVKELGHVTLADDLALLEEQLAALKTQVTRLKTRVAHAPESRAEDTIKTASIAAAGSAGDCNAARECRADLPPARR